MITLKSNEKYLVEERIATAYVDAGNGIVFEDHLYMVVDENGTVKFCSRSIVEADGERAVSNRSIREMLENKVAQAYVACASIGMTFKEVMIQCMINKPSYPATI